MTSSAQVNVLSILFMCVSLLVCFGAPIGLMIWAKVKYKKAFSFVPLALGAAGFFAAQIIFRELILNQLILSSFDWYKSFMKMTVPFMTFSCLMAGLVEEPARFAVFSILRKKRQFPDGLSYGIGHGGIEAVLLAGLPFINYIVYALAINAGSWNTLISVVPPGVQEQYETVRQALVSNSPFIWLIGGLERIFALSIHLGLSMLVLTGFQKGKRLLYLLLAIVAHGLMNFIPVVLLPVLGVTNPWLVEAVIGVEAAIAVWFTVTRAREWRKSLTAAEGAATPNPS